MHRDVSRRTLTVLLLALIGCSGALLLNSLSCRPIVQLGGQSLRWPEQQSGRTTLEGLAASIWQSLL